MRPDGILHLRRHLGAAELLALLADTIQAGEYSAAKHRSFLFAKHRCHWIMARPMGVPLSIPSRSQYNRIPAASSSARAFATWRTLLPSRSIDQTIRMS